VNTVVRGADATCGDVEAQATAVSHVQLDGQDVMANGLAAVDDRDLHRTMMVCRLTRATDAFFPPREQRRHHSSNRTKHMACLMCIVAQHAQASTGVANVAASGDSYQGKTAAQWAARCTSRRV
jgi:hypothetical protein